MPQRNDASALLSDVLVWMKYARNIGGRRETWPEIVERSAAMHRERFPQIAAEIDRAFALVEQRKILPSMRSLQFAGKAIERHESRMYNCLARETRFITSTGVKSFEDFEDGDVVEVLTHKGRWREAVVRRYGEQPLQKITFHRGRTEKVVFATKNHRWILFDEEETTEIAAKDILFPIEEMKSFDYEAAEPLEKLYWCYGFVFGDGTRVKKKDGDYGYSMVRLCTNKAKFADRFKEVGFKTSENLSCGGDVFAYTGTYLKSPPRIEEDGISLVSAFVDGYLCADGHVKQNKSRSNEEGGYRGIQCTGEEYIRFIREAFESCGYFILSERDLTGQKTNHGTRPATSHFSLTRKIGHRKDMAWSCASIEQTDRLESVWCLEVEEDKSFVLSGGIVTGNCCYAPLQDLRTFAELFFNLLCGTGTGYSVERRFLSQLPHLADSFDAETPTAIHRIEDSIEGWSDAILLLLETYAKGQTRISFDYSAIRPKGTPLKTTGGYAPGHEPLQRSLEAVEGILQGAMGRQLRPIEAHDVMCHIANAVYAGGIRRAAMICFFDRDDEEMLRCKEGEWWRENSQRARANNSAVLPRQEVSEEDFVALMQKIQANNTGEPGVLWVTDIEARFNPCFRGDMNLLTAEGYKTFAELDGKTLDLVNADGEAVRGRVWKSGEKQVVEVSMHRHSGTGDVSSLFCTPDHIFRTSEDKEVMAKDLKGHRIEPKCCPPSHEKHFVRLGFIQGDGCVTDVLNKDKRGISVSMGEKDDDIRVLFEVMNAPRNRGYYLRGFQEDLLSLGFVLKPLPERDLPSTFQTWSDARKKAFLCGLFSANGSVIKTGKRVALKTTCKALAESVSAALRDFSIQSYTTTNKSHDVDFPNGTYPCKESYDVNICRYDGMLRFANEIGFAQKYKQDALREALCSKAPVVAKVSLVEGGPVPVYDFSLNDGKHWGIVEGVVAHNCAEASLDPFTFCNLTTINVADVVDEMDFLERCWAASLIGTLQASFTGFSYLSERWSEATRNSSLLGVSLTGLASRRLEALEIDLSEGANCVKQVNAHVADLIGIPRAHRTTLIKPEGTTSLILGTSSGLHAYHSPYYLRGVTVGKDEPIYPVLKEIMPDNLPDYWEDPQHKVFAQFPICAPEDAISRHDESAIDLLERAKAYTEDWIFTGHRVGGNPHNASITVSVRDHEWEDLITWMWKNRECYAGIAVLPYWGGTHPQLPFLEVDRETFDLYLSRINGQFDALQIPEEWRTEALEDVAACVGGVCEIL